MIAKNRRDVAYSLTPQQLAEAIAAMKVAKGRRDVAYGCYLWVGIYLVVGAVVSFIGTRHITKVGPFELGDPIVFAFAFFVPLTILTIPVFVFAIGYSISARSDRPLWVLAVTSILYLALALSGVKGDLLDLSGIFLSTLILLLVPRWFFWARRRFREP